MKRTVLLILVFSSLLSGCSALQNDQRDKVHFYYLREEYRYGPDSSVIEAEERDPAGHQDNLSYMLALYLMGPTEKDHVMPLPAGTRIYVKERDEANIKIELSSAAAGMTDTEFSLASACLSLTCFDMTQVNTVTIVCGSRSITMVRDGIMLTDETVPQQETEESQ